MNKTAVHEYAGKEPPVFVKKNHPGPLVGTPEDQLRPRRPQRRNPGVHHDCVDDDADQDQEGRYKCVGSRGLESSPELVQIFTEIASAAADLRDSRPRTGGPGGQPWFHCGEERRRFVACHGSHLFQVLTQQQRHIRIDAL